MVRSYILFLACWVAFSWALYPAGGFGYVAALMLALWAGVSYARYVERQKERIRG